MWALRLFGLTLSAAALGWLIWLGHALYTQSRFGLIVLVELGMPAALFGALACGVAVGLGLWLAGLGRLIRRGPSRAAGAKRAGWV